MNGAGPVRKAVFPAAGLGTRFLPATKALPKEMVPVFDRPAIELGVEEAARSGIRDILIVTGRGKEAIENHFDLAPELEAVLEEKGKEDDLAKVRHPADSARIHFVRQKRAEGLGHAVLMGESFVGNEPFAVVLPDDLIYAEVPVLARMMEVFSGRGGSVIALEEVPEELVSSYGVVSGSFEDDRVFRIEDMVEKPPRESAPSNLAVVGRYIFTPTIFSCLKETGRGKGNEIQLTDAVRLLLRKEAVFGLLIEGRRYDTGTPLGFLEAVVEYALRSPEGSRAADFIRRAAENL